MSKADKIFLLSFLAVYLAIYVALSILTLIRIVDWSMAALLPMPLFFVAMLVLVLWGLAKTIRGTWL